MILALDTNSTIDYYLKEDTEKTVKFKLAPLDSYLKLHVEKEIKNEFKSDGQKFADITNPDREYSDTDIVYIAYVYMKYAEYGLRGWENFQHADGTPAEYKMVDISIPLVGKRSIISKESLKAFSVERLIELGRKVLELSNVSPEEKKT